MIRRMTRLSTAGFILFLIVLLFHSPDAFPENQKSFLWKIQSKTATVYLLGSLHLLKKEVYPLGKEIEEAFDKSDSLVVEADIGKLGQMDKEKLMKHALYPGEDSLEKHVSKETYELIRKKVTEIGIPLEIINRQKPWFLAILLSTLELVKLGMDPHYGIDRYFLTKAAGRKRILELESAGYQMSFFSEFSEQEEELLILWTLKDLENAGQMIDQVIKAWRSGDTESLESISTKGIREDPRLAAIYEKITYDRNKNMVARIEEFLGTGETFFVVVGAAHLTGNKGIVELLRGKGYRVEQVFLSK